MSAALVAVAVVIWSVLGTRSDDGSTAAGPSDETQVDATPAPGSPQDRDAEEAETPPTPSREILWSGTFDGDDWTERFGVVIESRTNAEVVSSGPDGRDDVLRITFGAEGDRWGIDYRALLDELDLPDLQAVELSYDVYFEPDFEFIGDGKFGGLAGAEVEDGVDFLNLSSGGNFDEGSFSARAMWKEDRGVVGYLYVPYADGRTLSDPDNYGFGIQAPFVAADGSTAGVLTPGVWQRITHRVVLNTPGEADGTYQMDIDGHRGIDLDDVEFRTGSATELPVNLIMSTWFFGGGSDQYPTRVNTAYTADWELSIPEDLLDQAGGVPSGDDR